MAMRRPRIKPQANIQLNAKRKSKNEETKLKPALSENKLTVVAQEIPVERREHIVNPLIPNELKILEQQKQSATSSDCVTNDEKIISSVSIDTNTQKENCLKNSTNNAVESEIIFVYDTQLCEDVIAGSKNSPKTGNDQNNELLKDTEAFKCPPKVEYQRSISHTSNCGADDVFYSDIEENAMQLDLQRSPSGCPMSPSKSQTRQRIKATPVFGQRRNSLVGSSPNPHASYGEDVASAFNENIAVTPRRERHISASMSVISNSSSTSHHHHVYAPHKYLPNGVMGAGVGRMRTESGCSVFSDTNVNSHKSKKNEDHKINLKREYEARFINGVPDKSCIKMSDLIYYNPVTNPMEQKSNLNLKHESGDGNASLEIKPFKHKIEKDTEEVAEEPEAMLVPQLKLDSNGELILDDKSLVIETTAEQEARKVLANSSLIYLDENTGMNGFYSRRKRTREWPASETVKFYRCLQTVGTDFSIMVPLFPNRTRRDLKLKFKKEERINGNLINKALLYPKQFNVEDLKQQIEEEEKKREAEAQRLKELKEAAAKEVKKRKFGRSSAERALNGRNVYSNENIQKVKKSRNANNKTRRLEAAKKINAAVEATLTENNNVIGTHLAKGKIQKPPKVKRRKHKHNTVLKKDKTEMKEQKEIDKPENVIKEEMFKKEVVHPHTKIEAFDYQHNDEMIEVEVEVEIDEHNHSEGTAVANLDDISMHQYDATSVSTNEQTITSDFHTFVLKNNSYNEDSNVIVDDDCESRTFVNLDDGSFTTVNDMNNYVNSYLHSQLQQQQLGQDLPAESQPTPSTPTHVQDYFGDESEMSPQPPSPIPSALTPQPPDLDHADTCSSQISERELNESDIEQILTELSEGSLFLVSTLHPDDPDNVLNEIFMVDKNTGVLCDEPLDIPDYIVQCILSAMS